MQGDVLNLAPVRARTIAWLPLMVAAGALLAVATTSRADTPAPGATSEPVPESPWLLVPTLSSNPKLGTSLGGMAAYMYFFDPQSKPSLFGASAQYTSTDSIVASLFAKTSFDADHQRVSALLASGTIKNDYDDFLGTGQPLKSEDNLRAFAVRYQYRVWGDWFVGAQFVNSNYEILGATALDQETLQTLGLTPLKAGGIGVIANLDSRDSEYSPHRGWLVNINNIAYRDWIAGKENYDVYRADERYYWEHGDRNVLAVRQSNVWTSDAPSSAYAPITLRGYKFGEYLGKYMSSLEAEERLRLAARWTATAFVGIGCLYGGDLKCSDGANVYPDVGVGVQYVIKEKQGMVLNLEYAKGKGDNQGVLLKFGYGY
jgi:hypothetical protein